MNHATRIRIGISSCLLGEQVRYDGGHKRDRFITDEPSPFVEFVPICPEVAIGLGVPRQPIRLVADAGGCRAVGIHDSGLDVTDDLIRFARETSCALHKLSGYIFKSNSPSCGTEHVKLYPEGGPMPTLDGVGVYAAAVMKLAPNLPVEEESRLNDLVLRENFVERIVVYQRWQDMLHDDVDAAKLADFHTRHELTLLSRGQHAYQQLGELIANDDERPVAQLAELYVAALMQALRRPAGRRGHAGVLKHVQGYLKDKLDKSDKRKLAAINQYRLGCLPWAVPLALLNRHLERSPDAYIAQRVYLNPHPSELMLRKSL